MTETPNITGGLPPGGAQTFTLRLEAPVCVGSRRWRMIQSTRLYAPGWTLWGLLTRTETRAVHPKPLFSDYQEIGRWLDRNLWISHGCLALDLGEDGRWHYLPHLEQESGGIVFRWTRAGGEAGAEDAGRVLNSTSLLCGWSSTAVTGVKGAVEGSLHAMEAISPRVLYKGKTLPVYVVFSILPRPGLEGSFPEPGSSVGAANGGGGIHAGQSGLQLLDILKRSKRLVLGRSGGAGLGLVRCVDAEFPAPAPEKLAHVTGHEGCCYRGGLEPIVLRRWHERLGPGKALVFSTLALVPGSEIIGLKPFRLSAVHGCLAVGSG